MKIPIRSRLILLFSPFLIGLLIIAYYSWASMSHVDDLVTGMTDEEYPSIQMILKMELAKAKQAIYLRSYISTRSNQSFRAYSDEKNEFVFWADSLRTMGLTVREQALLNEIETLNQKYNSISEKVILQVQANEIEKARTLVNKEIVPIRDKIFDRLQKMQNSSLKDAQARHQLTKDKIEKTRSRLVIIPILIFALGGLIIIIFLRNLFQAFAMLIEWMVNATQRNQ